MRILYPVFVCAMTPAFLQLEDTGSASPISLKEQKPLHRFCPSDFSELKSKKFFPASHSLCNYAHRALLLFHATTIFIGHVKEGGGMMYATYNPKSLYPTIRGQFIHKMGTDF